MKRFRVDRAALANPLLIQRTISKQVHFPHIFLFHSLWWVVALFVDHAEGEAHCFHFASEEAVVQSQ